MVDKIPLFLQEKLNQTKRIITHKFPIDIKDYLINYAKYYNWELGENVTLIFKTLKQHQGHLPKCQYKDCTNIVKITKEGIISQACCQQHSVKITNLRKYGVESNLHIPEVREKIELDNLEKYGCRNVAQSKIIQDKMKSTNLELYGVENIMHDKNICSKVLTSMKSTMLERYGVEHALDNPIIFEKYNKNLYKFKEFIWKTGEVSKIQGFEHIVLKELEITGYTYNDVLTNAKDMPIFYYYYKGKKHRYYPDFYIPSENLIIEVKSQWTLNKQLEKNLIKFQAVKDAGYEFRLEIR